MKFSDPTANSPTPVICGQYNAIYRENLGLNANRRLYQDIRTDIGLSSQKAIWEGRSSPYALDFLNYSGGGYINMNLLKTNVVHPRSSSPVPKENLPCFGGLVFVPIRDLTYTDALEEIKSYIEKVGGRKVYISELAEELQIDMDLIEEILNDIQG